MIAIFLNKRFIAETDSSHRNFNGSARVCLWRASVSTADAIHRKISFAVFAALIDHSSTTNDRESFLTRTLQGVS